MEAVLKWQLQGGIIESCQHAGLYSGAARVTGRVGLPGEGHDRHCAALQQAAGLFPAATRILSSTANDVCVTGK